MVRISVYRTRWLWKSCFLLLLATDTGAGDAAAATVAAKNKQGNQLFYQGKYQDAEKAYLDAQLEAPGRPELLYNLGNTLIKRKKYDEAAQSLRQAVSKGDKGLQESGWYNLGNVLFESAKYGEAAQAYIQALHLNPADKDAKHNLELAWRKVQEQKQNSSGKDRKREQQKNAGNEGNQQQERGDKEKKDKDQAGDAQGKQDRQPASQQQGEQREGSISKEQALQILDAMKNQELTEQRKLLERQERRKAIGKDW